MQEPQILSVFHDAAAASGENAAPGKAESLLHNARAQFQSSLKDGVYLVRVEVPA
jgi:hypothetical protein